MLAVPGEAELLALQARLERAGVAHVLIHEPDPPWLGQATAIGLVPVSDRDALRPLLSSLPLYGRTPRCRDCVDAGGLCYTHNGGLDADRRVAALMNRTAPPATKRPLEKRMK